MQLLFKKVFYAAHLLSNDSRWLNFRTQGALLIIIFVQIKVSEGHKIFCHKSIIGHLGEKEESGAMTKA